MKILCYLLGHNFKVIGLDERQGKYFHIEECSRCLKKKEIPSVVNDIEFKCCSSCPTCHGKS